MGLKVSKISTIFIIFVPQKGIFFCISFILCGALRRLGVFNLGRGLIFSFLLKWSRVILGGGYPKEIFLESFCERNGSDLCQNIWPRMVATRGGLCCPSSPLRKKYASLLGATACPRSTSATVTLSRTFTRSAPFTASKTASGTTTLGRSPTISASPSPTATVLPSPTLTASLSPSGSSPPTGMCICVSMPVWCVKPTE